MSVLTVYGHKVLGLEERHKELDFLTAGVTGDVEVLGGVVYYSYAVSYEGVDYAYLWRLEEYRSTVKKETQTDAWDELEKSVIASASDDVIVGVRGKRAEIVIVKKFA